MNDYAIVLQKKGVSNDFIRDVVSTLALPVSNTILYNTVLSGWIKEGMQSCSSMNAILMRWDYAEANPLVSHYAGGLEYSFRQSLLAMESCAHISNPTSSVFKLDATALPLPDDSADIFFTDPPYYDTIPYADLSDMFYVWLKRFIGKYHPDLFAKSLTPKEQQLVVNPYATRDGRGDQSPERYKRLMTLAFNEGRRVLKPDGIGTIVFAHKGTEAWETLLSSIIDAGFIVTASWPIDTERAARMRANKSAALGSSVHIVVRPRKILMAPYAVMLLVIGVMC